MLHTRCPPPGNPQRRSMSLVRVGAVLSTVAASALVLSAVPASAAAAPALDSAGAENVALGVRSVQSYVVAVHATGATSVTARSERTTAHRCDSFADDQ